MRILLRLKTCNSVTICHLVLLKTFNSVIITWKVFRNISLYISKTHPQAQVYKKNPLLVTFNSVKTFNSVRVVLN